MSHVPESLVEAIQASGFNAAMVVTGGGSGAIHALLSHPGASRFMIEAQIPYSSEALGTYLGETPSQSCSEETARQLAAKALERASSLKPHLSNLIGVACTAALQTNRERKGSDRAFICIQSSKKEVLHKLELAPDRRVDQENIVTEKLLKLIAEFVGVED